MKPSLHILLLTFVSILDLSSAPLGTAFTYQGRLIDGGVPATGIYDLEFSLFDAASAGSGVANTVEKEDVPVTNGLFTVELDFGPRVFSGNAVWLSMGVRPGDSTGGFATLPLRQALSPAPYALYAVNAASANSVAASNLTGTVPDARLSANVALLNGTPNFTGGLTADFLAGNGSGVTNVNAARLGGVEATSFWNIGGNHGTTPGTNFIGTTDNQALEIKVNGLRALRIQPTAGGPNMIAGSHYNWVLPAVRGATIGGGGNTDYPNSVTGNYGTVGGGEDNSSSAYATVGGGQQNTSSGFHATVGGGLRNTNSGEFATVGGGKGNNSSADSATVAGGSSNIIDRNSFSSTIGGGTKNTIASNAPYATIPGGRLNVANTYAFAAGFRAKAYHEGAFVWADSTNADFASTANNQFLIRASGGVGININNPTDAALSVNGAVRLNDKDIFFRADTDQNHGLGWYGAGKNFGTFVSPDGPVLYGFAGGALGTTSGFIYNWSLRWEANGDVFTRGTLNPPSDRNMKTNFTAINPRDVLDKVSAMAINTWEYKDSLGSRHVGPVAQDFHAAFGLGQSDKSIATVDADGVALAAIQGLHQVVKENEKLVQAKEAEISSLKERLSALEKLVGTLVK